MNFYRRLYAANFLNTFGSWLTFLAIALSVQERHGPSFVALVFMLQTLPTIIFSKALNNLIPPKYHERAFLGTQVLLAINSLVLCFSQSLTVIFIHLFIGALLKTISNPLFSTLTGRWVKQDDLQLVMGRMGAIQAGTLAIAPAVGAWIKINFSVESLFAIDALTFLISAAWIGDLLMKVSFQGSENENIKNKTPFSLKQLINHFIPKPKEIALWFVFLAVGALLNAIEFAGFAQVSMTEQQIGYALTFWGIGNWISFSKLIRIDSKFTAIGYLGALAVFAFANTPILASIGFAFAGYFYCEVSGALRAGIQSSVPVGFNALPVWAYANQVTQIINLIAYLSAGAFLNTVGYPIFASIMLVVASILPIQYFKKVSV